MTEEPKDAKPDPLPEEVKKILNKMRKMEYHMLIEAGWCPTCCREHTIEGQSKCPSCMEKHRIRTFNKRRSTWPGTRTIYGGRGRPPIGCDYTPKSYNHKPWEPGGRGRPPKSAKQRGGA